MRTSWPGSGRPHETTRPSSLGPRPGGETVSATDASASPYTGVSAAGRKPYAAKRRAKRASVSALTGSEPLNARRHAERSTPSSSASATLRPQRSKAKFGAGESVARCAWSARSQRAGRARKSSGERITTGTPK